MADEKPDPRQIDFLVSPEDEAGTPVGTIRGPRDWHEGLGAGLDVYIGGGEWRSLGDLISLAAGITMHRGRLSAGLVFDLGEAELNRGRSLSGLAHGSVGGLK